MLDPHADTLTPAAAQARFGELRHAPTATYMQFSDPGGGVWRAELGPDLELLRYRLHRLLRVPHVRAPYRPRQRD